MHRRPKLSIRLPLDVTLAYERCCVTKIRFIRVCMGNNGFVLKVKKCIFCEHCFTQEKGIKGGGGTFFVPPHGPSRVVT